MIKIGPITPEGEIEMKFSEPILAPNSSSKLNSKILNNLFGVKVQSLNNDNNEDGDFGSKRTSR